MLGNGSGAKHRQKALPHACFEPIGAHLRSSIILHGRYCARMPRPTRTHFLVTGTQMETAPSAKVLDAQPAAGCPLTAALNAIGGKWNDLPVLVGHGHSAIQRIAASHAGHFAQSVG